MRQEVATKYKIRAGDRVRIFVKLPVSMEVSRVSVWVREREDLPFSPYVDPLTSEWLEKGRPSFARPFHQRLHEQKRSHVFDFIAYSDMAIRLIQDVDTLEDKKPKVRIKRYGKVAQAFERWRDNAKRIARRYFEVVGNNKRPNP